MVPEPPGKIDAGSVTFNAKDLLKLNPEELQEVRGKDIAMVFQDPMTSLNPVLTLGDQMMEPILRHTSLNPKEAWEKAVDILRSVEIPSPLEKMNQYPHQLSGGMRQRVMIGMALTCSPKILIADEPTTALDVLIQAQIMDLLQHLKEQTGMSILLITHDLGMVTEIAQRVIVMYAGEIVESGPARDLFQTPLHPYTLGLKNSVPKLGQKQRTDKRLVVISGNVPSLNQLPSGCPFHPRCPSVWNDANRKNLFYVKSARTRSFLLAGGKPGMTPPSSGPNLLEVRQLKKHFSVGGSLLGKQAFNVRAVDGVSFAIKQGETLGLVGESGCGKSTVARAILRLMEPTSGEVFYRGTTWPPLVKMKCRP